MQCDQCGAEDKELTYNITCRATTTGKILSDVSICFNCYVVMADDESLLGELLNLPLTTEERNRHYDSVYERMRGMNNHIPGQT
jgi:hypothetical protein